MPRRGAGPLAAQGYAHCRQRAQHLGHGGFGLLVRQGAVWRAENKVIGKALFALAHFLTGVHIEQGKAFQHIACRGAYGLGNVRRGHARFHHKGKVARDGRVLWQRAEHRRAAAVGEQNVHIQLCRGHARLHAVVGRRFGV